VGVCVGVEVALSVGDPEPVVVAVSIGRFVVVPVLLVLAFVGADVFVVSTTVVAVFVSGAVVVSSTVPPQPARRTTATTAKIVYLVPMYSAASRQFD
jgi:hypothetical protein